MRPIPMLSADLIEEIDKANPTHIRRGMSREDIGIQIGKRELIDNLKMRLKSQAERDLQEGGDYHIGK